LATGEGADLATGSRCANCAKSDLICTYVECAKKRAPSKSSYVESLEAEVMKLRVLLQKVVPDVDLSGDLDLHELPQITKPTISGTGAEAIRRSGNRLDEYPKDDSMLLPDTLTQPFQSQSQDRFFGKPSDIDSQARYLGKSSGVIFLKEALEKRPSGHRFPAESLSARRAKYWVPHPVCIYTSLIPRIVFDLRVLQWEEFLKPDTGPIQYIFPEDDLMLSLIDLYFDRVNLFSPLLHRPSFMKSIQQNQHQLHKGFACVLLLVCAVGARFSDDPRVLSEGTDMTLSCGWKWFNQAHAVSKPAFAPATIHDLQTACLSVEFLQGASVPSTCWTITGVAIRQAQDVGAHRWKTFGTKPKSIEQELWKRAWWSLVSKDRIASAASGRPCITQDEDYDIGLPTECDDEYWDHPDPEKSWKQPEGVPSMVAYFNSHLRMSQILAHTLSSLYRSNKSESDSESTEPERGSELVMELDSALNKWVDSIPDHLKWNPNQPNLIWRRQSLALYAHYYLLQISIHRPFISSTASSLPSLAICTNAARACSHLIDLEDEACALTLHRMQWPVFSATVVLLLNLWSGKRSGLSTDPTKGMKDVNRCMESFRYLEKGFQTAGKLWDLLDFLMTAAGYIQHPEPMDTEGSTEIPNDIPPKSSDDTVHYNETPVDGASEYSAESSSFYDASFDSIQSMGHPSSTQRAMPSVAPISSHISHQEDSAQLPPLHHNSYSVVSGDIESWETMIRPGIRTEETKAQDSFSEITASHDNGFSNYYATAQPQNSAVPDFSAHYQQAHDHPTFDGSTHYPSSVPVQDIFDAETMQMWTTAPLGFEADAWGSYISNVNQIHMMSSMDNLHVYSEQQ
jgi:hypothetical protein